MTLKTTFIATVTHAAGSATLKAVESRELAGTGFINLEQEIGSDAFEPIDVTDIGVLGFLFIRNDDPTNYVLASTTDDDTGIFALLKPGRGLPVEVQVGAPYFLKASSATVKVLIMATEI